MRRLLAIIICGLAGSTAAACVPEDFAMELAIQDFGTAWFNSLQLEPDQTSATLSGGVCVVAPGNAWQVEAESANVTGLQFEEAIIVSASQAQLAVPGWEIYAELVISNEDGFDVHEATFTAGDLQGTAESARYNLFTGDISVTGLDASGTGYRLIGESASFAGSSLEVTGARITTCMCPGEPLYELVGDSAELDLGNQRLLLHRGRLLIRSLEFELADPFEMSGESLQELEFPFSVEYSGSTSGTPQHGHGLAVLLNPQELAPGVELGLGITGLEGHHPLAMHGQLTYSVEGTRALLGVQRSGGYRAEFSTRQALLDWLDFEFSTTQRHYADADYLHDGTLRLIAGLPAAETRLGGRITTGFTAFASASSQTFGGGTVTGPRLGVSASFDYRAPALPLGQLSLQLDAQDTAYPLAGTNQFALRLRPAWSLTNDALKMNLALDWRLTNSASPFSGKHDRLDPLLKLTGSVTYAPGNSSVGISATHNFLRFPSGEVRGFENLLLHARTETTAGDWTIRPGARLQLAGWLDPRATSDRLAFIEASVYGQNGDIELGFMARYHFAGLRSGFETLQVSGAYPFQLENVRLVPFLALEFSDVVHGTGGLGVAGHGIVINWDSCCGLIELGYRVHNNEFNLSLGASFVRRRE